ncbi:unnamed protein product [Gadus morhua 'NCC']
MPAGRACLQCDRKTRLLHEDFLLSAASVEKQIALTMIRDHAYVTYRQTSQAHRGVIDPTTFYRVSTEYHSEFNRIKKTLQPDQLDCGEHHLEAEEGDQAVLNCFLPWHSLIQGTPEYHFTWAPGPPGSTQEPSVVLNQLHAKEQGTYRCSLQDRKATVFSTVTFFLTVTALPTQTPIQLITLVASHRPHSGPWTDNEEEDEGAKSKENGLIAPAARLIPNNPCESRAD